MTSKTAKKPAAPRKAKTKAAPKVEDARVDDLSTQDGDAVGEVTPVPAAKPRATSLFGKQHPVLLTLEIPGYVPRANREITMVDLRQGLVSPETLEELLEELLAQF